LDMYRLNPRCFLEWHSRVSLCGGYLCILTARNECWLANGAPNNKKASAGLYVDSPLSQFPEFSDSPNSTLFPALRLLGLGRWASGNWSRSPATMGPEWAKTGWRPYPYEAIDSWRQNPNWNCRRLRSPRFYFGSSAVVLLEIAFNAAWTWKWMQLLLHTTWRPSPKFRCIAPAFPLSQGNANLCISNWSAKLLDALRSGKF